MRTTKHTIAMSNAEWGAIMASLNFFADQVQKSGRDYAFADATYLRTLAKFIRGTMDANYENEEV